MWPVPHGTLLPGLSTAHPLTPCPQAPPEATARDHLRGSLAQGKLPPPQQQCPAEGQSPAGLLRGAMALLPGQPRGLGHHAQATGCGPSRA